MDICNNIIRKHYFSLQTITDEIFHGTGIRPTLFNANLKECFNLATLGGSSEDSFSLVFS